NPLPAAALRLVAWRKPAGAVEVLLNYLPFADTEAQAGEVKRVLAALAWSAGQPDAVLVGALNDPRAPRRAAAVEALCRAGGDKLLPTVRKLLQDPEPAVRLHVALALAIRGDK